jgi:hypothetical protein
LYQEALGVERTLLDRFGDAPGRQRLVALTHLRVAEADVAIGLPGDARREYDMGLMILRRLAETGVRLPGLMRDVALGLTHLSDAVGVMDARGASGTLLDGIGILRELLRVDPADARLQHDLLAALVHYGDLQRAQRPAVAHDANTEARDIARALNRRSIGDAVSRRDLEIVSSRLNEATSEPELTLELYALDNAGLERSPITPEHLVPETATYVSVAAHVPQGWVGYLVTFGAAGKAAVLDESQLGHAGWRVPLSGPPPAETILLLAVRRRLSDAEKQAIEDAIGEVPGPRAIEGGGQLVWQNHAEATIASRFSSRGIVSLGGPGTEWVADVRARLLRIGGARFSGRTFTIPSR